MAQKKTGFLVRQFHRDAMLGKDVVQKNLCSPSTVIARNAAQKVNTLSSKIATLVVYREKGLVDAGKVTRLQKTLISLLRQAGNSARKSPTGRQLVVSSSLLKSIAAADSTAQKMCRAADKAKARTATG